MSLLFFPILISLFSVVFSYFLIRKINQASSDSGKAAEISQAIKEGTVTYLKREYKMLGFTTIFFALIIGFLIKNIEVVFGFLLGAIFSALIGYLGMMVSAKSNLKVVKAGEIGLKESLDLSFKGGSVTGFLVVGLGLFLVSTFYGLTKNLEALIALGFGASLISIFARLGGGIFTKAADVGADIVGKIEKGIPEDDPRNPAVIADQVGDNVGDCVGMAADLFETFVVTLVAAMVLGSFLFPQVTEAVFLPLLLVSIAILASIISTFFIRLPARNASHSDAGGDKNQSIILAFYKGLLVAGILSAIGFFLIISQVFANFGMPVLNLYLPALFGLLFTGFIFLATEFYTSKKFNPVKSIANSSQSGHASNIIAGLSVGMKATILPIVLVSIGILFSFKLAGFYGLSLVTVSMLSLVGLIVALDSYGPIADNAAGISEMAGLPEKVRKNMDILDSAGNTTKEMTKAYTITSAGLAALVLFSAYTQKLTDLGLKIQFSLEDPSVLVGLFIGGIIVYYFSALSIEAVGKTALKVVEEVRRQFKEIKGIMEGETKPEYGKCVDIVTKGALKEMTLPAILPVIFPVLVGFFLGPKVLGGLLIGSIITGMFMAIFMTVSGAAWDNAKKYIEEGNFGGKRSFSHQAAVTGDTVGDPLKDTAGPSINPMIKILNIIALLIVKFLV
jgi:K(+)-stimulated pyrophosphate-energized sodium pump